MFAASKSARSAAAAGDNKFNYVTLLLNGDGTNGKQNNTFVDGSTNNFTITRNGTPTQGSFSPYGSLWSNYFNGSSYLTWTGTALGSGDFTVECWVFLPAAIGSNKGIIGSASSNTSAGWEIYVSNTNVVKFYTNSADAIVGPAISLNQWVHIAAVRSGSTLTLYVNGTSGGTATLTANLTNTSYYVSSDGFSQTLNSYISNVRHVVGTAVYTGSFTPSTTPLTAITNTSVLTCQSNRFRDASSNNFTITVNGTPSVQRFSPFEPSTSYTPAVNGGSGYFNGSSDSLTVTSNVANFGTGDFTVEAWVYLTGSGGGYPQLISAKNAVGPQFGFVGTTQVTFYDGTTGYTYSTGSSANQWAHVAFVRSSGTFKIYVNGTQVGSFTYTGAINLNSTMVGAYNNGAANGYFQGYISDLRAVNGTAVYTAAFTPPTTPLTAVTNTSFLESFTNAGISDAAAANDLTTVGDAQVSTTVVKYGTASMKFDGTGDYLTLIDSPNLQLMAGDFTIEGWIYLAANGVVYGIVSKGTATTGWSVNVTIGNKLQFSYTLSNLTGATSLSASTWYHFAVVRSGTASGNLKVYLNGVADATSTGAVTDSFNQTSITYVGADRVATSQLNGYIDDLRITKGYARYTTNFTAPTAALPTF